jgi:hypothetical protein
MAKKAAVNKSAIIREALAAHRGTAPSEIATLLNEKHGLKLTGQYVSTIKSNALKKKGRRGGRRGTGRKSMTRVGGKGMGGIPAALEFIKATGGLEAAKSALGTLEEIGKAL